MHLINFGTVLWNPIFKISMALTSIGSQSLQYLAEANTEIMN